MKEFDVTSLGRTYSSLFGTEYIPITVDKWEDNKTQLQAQSNWTEYDTNMIRVHIANCGFGLIDAKCGNALDVDEEEMFDIYDGLNFERKND